MLVGETVSRGLALACFLNLTYQHHHLLVRAPTTTLLSAADMLQLDQPLGLQRDI